MSKPRKPNTSSDVLPITVAKNETDDEALARVAVGPTLSSALALNALHRRTDSIEGPALEDLVVALARTSADKHTTGTERLLSQAVVLDRLFGHLVGIALRQRYVDGMEAPLKLALRAQAQCRATLEAVSNIRHPRQFIGEQHVGDRYSAGGHMQVNRGGRDASEGYARRGANEKRPNELSHEEEPTRELHPNRGTPAGVERTSAEDASVGTRDRTANG